MMPRSGKPCLKRPASQALSESPFGHVEEDVPFTNMSSESEPCGDDDEGPSIDPTQPDGPHCPAQCFQWAQSFGHRMCNQLGPYYVLNALSNVRWQVHTMFSGVGCPEVALSMLKAGLPNIGPDFSDLRMDISLNGVSLDRNSDCRKVLKANCSDRCIFGDVQDFVASGQTLNKIKFKTCCHCYTHNQDCPLAPSRQEGVASVMVAGPPCTPWSKRGKRQGNKDIVWAKYVLENKIDLVVFECVCVMMRCSGMFWRSSGRTTRSAMLRCRPLALAVCHERASTSSWSVSSLSSSGRLRSLWRRCSNHC